MLQWWRINQWDKGMVTAVDPQDAPPGTARDLVNLVPGERVGALVRPRVWQPGFTWPAGWEAVIDLRVVPLSTGLQWYVLYKVNELDEHRIAASDPTTVYPNLSFTDLVTSLVTAYDRLTVLVRQDVVRIFVHRSDTDASLAYWFGQPPRAPTVPIFSDWYLDTLALPNPPAGILTFERFRLDSTLGGILSGTGTPSASPKTYASVLELDRYQLGLPADESVVLAGNAPGITADSWVSRVTISLSAILAGNPRIDALEVYRGVGAGTKRKLWHLDLLPELPALRVIETSFTVADHHDSAQRYTISGTGWGTFYGIPGENQPVVLADGDYQLLMLGLKDAETPWVAFPLPVGMVRLNNDLTLSPLPEFRTLNEATGDYAIPWYGYGFDPWEGPPLPGDRLSFMTRCTNETVYGTPYLFLEQPVAIQGDRDDLALVWVGKRQNDGTLYAGSPVDDDACIQNPETGLPLEFTIPAFSLQQVTGPGIPPPVIGHRLGLGVTNDLEERVELVRIFNAMGSGSRLVFHAKDDPGICFVPTYYNAGIGHFAIYAPVDGSLPDGAPAHWQAVKNYCASGQPLDAYPPPVNTPLPRPIFRAAIWYESPRFLYGDPPVQHFYLNPSFFVNRSLIRLHAIESEQPRTGPLDTDLAVPATAPGWSLRLGNTSIVTGSVNRIRTYSSLHMIGGNLPLTSRYTTLFLNPQPGGWPVPHTETQLTHRANWNGETVSLWDAWDISANTTLDADIGMEGAKGTEGDATAGFATYLNDRLVLALPTQANELLQNNLQYSTWQAAGVAQDLFDPLNQVPLAGHLLGTPRALVQQGSKLVALSDRSVVEVTIEEANLASTVVRAVWGANGIRARESLIRLGDQLLYLASDGIYQLSSEGFQEISVAIRNELQALGSVLDTFQGARDHRTGHLHWFVSQAGTFTTCSLDQSGRWYRTNLTPGGLDQAPVVIFREVPGGGPVISAKPGANGRFYRLGTGTGELASSSLRTHDFKLENGYQFQAHRLRFRGVTNDQVQLRLYIDDQQVGTYEAGTDDGFIDQILAVHSDNVAPLASPVYHGRTARLELSGSGLTEVHELALGYRAMVR